jgi:methylmalonyl-CoA/ethylmalonyl-CoA epimerase
VADSGEIAPLIRSLCLADPAKRAIAATEIFTRGSRMARAAAQEWLAHPPLASLLVHGPSGAVETTVGIAVEPDTFGRLRSANGSPRLADVPPDQDAQEFELDFPGGVRIDILTTRQPGGAGAIARYLLRFGEGIQQVEINVTDVDRATEILRTRFKLEPVYPATRAGADGTRINFFLAPRPGGGKVLIELVEPTPKS